MRFMGIARLAAGAVGADREQLPLGLLQEFRCGFGPLLLHLPKFGRVVIAMRAEAVGHAAFFRSAISTAKYSAAVACSRAAAFRRFRSRSSWARAISLRSR